MAAYLSPAEIATAKGARLTDILPALGYSCESAQHKEGANWGIRDGSQLHGKISISNLGAGSQGLWRFRKSGESGVGAIKLVQAIEGGSWLEAAHRVLEIVGGRAKPVAPVVPVATRPQSSGSSVELWSPDPEAWPGARGYILSRGLPAALVDEAHAAGKIFGRRGNRVGKVPGNCAYVPASGFWDMPCWHLGIARPIGAECRWFTGQYSTQAGSKKHQPWLWDGDSNQPIVIFEGILDALSYRAMFPGTPVAAITGAGNVQAALELAKYFPDRRLACGYDADAAGDQGFDMMLDHAELVGIERLRPPEVNGLGKKSDWNDVLRKAAGGDS